MRGDGVGVGDIGEVPEQPRGRRDEARDGDDGRAIGKHEPGVVGGYGHDEHNPSFESGRNGIGISYGARGEPWAGGVHGNGAGRADGMRGDGVGVGDIGEVPCRVLGWGDWTCGGDCRGACGHRQYGVVRG